MPPIRIADLDDGREEPERAHGPAHPPLEQGREHEHAAHGLAQLVRVPGDLIGERRSERGQAHRLPEPRMEHDQQCDRIG
jgi:hypothetical protein